MSHKLCPKCQKKNAPGNRNCVKCGRTLLYETILSDRKKGSLSLYIMERVFSSVLVSCAVISIFFAVMTFLRQPAFSIIDSLY